MRKVLLLSTFFFISALSISQDLTYAKKIVDTLTSPFFWGRGYTNNGMSKAAEFLALEMRSFGVKPMNGKYFLQPFTYSVNTFPGKMEVAVNGKQLIAGKDFIVAPESRGAKAATKLIKQDSTHYVDPGNRIIVSLENKLTWSVAPRQADYTTIVINKKSIDKSPVDLQTSIESKLVQAFKAYNVCGIVRGTSMPDSIIVFTAHYDHLGGLGKSTFFPGANDNASGVSLLLSLAKHYAANPAPYSVGFICFAGEEAGLVGSKYFTDNPLMPLSQVRFLLNVDLVGTGDDGITVVNATEFPKEYTILNQVNDAGKYVVKINARGKAANSDHYWFSEKGVPAFFLYTLGGIAAYHDVYDKSVTLPLTEYNDLFKLIVGFNEKLMGSPKLKMQNAKSVE